MVKKVENKDYKKRFVNSFNKHAGQFFTPYSICEAMANVLIERKQLGKTVHKEGYASTYVLYPVIIT